MNIIIVGSGGQLGAELQRILRTGTSELGQISDSYQGCNVIPVDIDGLDITDSEAVLEYMGANNPDIVMNCAAMTDVNGCESNREQAMRVNAIGARNLAIACEQVHCKLVQVSTDYVFPGNGTKPYEEWDNCDPQSIYGSSKLQGERYVRDYCSQYFIVRTAWLYGYTGKNFVKTMLKLGKERGSVKVVNDQRGNPTNAVDLAHHLLQIAATDEYGIYHCTGNGECSWYDFACKIMEEFGVDCTVSPCTTEEFPSPAKRPAFSSLDNLMLRATVGDSMRHWQDALHSFAANYTTHSD